MREPTTALGWAYKLHDHLTRGAAYRYRNLQERAAEHDRQATACVAGLVKVGDQREGMLRALETLETMCAECHSEDEHICPDTILLVIEPVLAGAREGKT